MKNLEHATLYGIIWILINNLNMSVQSGTIKWLSVSLGSGQILFLYKLTVLVCAFIWVCFTGFGQLKTEKIHLHILRSTFSIIGGLIFVHALKHIPLASAMVISFTEPLFTTILAVILLKETLNRYIVVALIVGFLGTTIALHPGEGSFNIYSVVVLASAVVRALDNIVIKFLGKTESSIQYLFYISLFTTSFAAPVAIYDWKPLTVNHISSVVALAIFHYIHVVAVFKAFQYSNLTILAPFDFSRIVFTTLIGALVFKEKVNLWEITGASLIIASTVYIIWFKDQHKNNVIVS
jgi:S-adenosylmethionine uptake transporter